MSTATDRRTVPAHPSAPVGSTSVGFAPDRTTAAPSSADRRPDSATPAVLAVGLRSSYPGRGTVLDGIDLAVAPGTVHGLLGPNGAGKSTTVRILATLQRFDSGTVRVAGHDLAREPGAVRSRIGVAGQHAALDPVLSGRENLTMFARLHRMRPRAARARAGELLDRFDLAAAADRPLRHYSGGMRRRLDLAVSLIRSPQVLFLDEPTTGLDPRSRSEVWDAVRELAAGGTTVLLTTQYLEEADRLCRRISLLRAGRIALEGSPDELKATIGGSRLEVAVPPGASPADISRTLAGALGVTTDVDDAARRVSAPLDGATDALARAAAALSGLGVHVDDLALRRPDLDDVFLRLTAPDISEGPHR
ncbi:ABC transporter ATP-binding protein [Georgenia sp. Z1344]|uniref:ABC transporter ATP-binding protein n=1 Tax=Georgenia sp. Z1344 TaxID=3416706 RepID=UPI003CF4363F